MVGAEVGHLVEHGRSGHIGDAAHDDAPWLASRMGIDRDQLGQRRRAPRGVARGNGTNAIPTGRRQGVPGRHLAERYPRRHGAVLPRTNARFMAGDLVDEPTGQSCGIQVP